VPHTQLRREKKEKERSRRGSHVESLKSSTKEEDNRVVVRIKTHKQRTKTGRETVFFLTVSECFL
jgi:hypothetical protein